MQEKNSGIGEKERIVEIEVERLREFRGHPFKVKPDDQMNMLMESIKKYGMLHYIDKNKKHIISTPEKGQSTPLNG